jgi:hypothetical protein
VRDVLIIVTLLPRSGERRHRIGPSRCAPAPYLQRTPGAGGADRGGILVLAQGGVHVVVLADRFPRRLVCRGGQSAPGLPNHGVDGLVGVVTEHLGHHDPGFTLRTDAHLMVEDDDREHGPGPHPPM